MITEDCCSYEVSKLLKEKGFDEPCLQMWECGPDKKYLFRLQSSCYQNITEEDSCLAPTHQMAMKWLREKSVIIVIQPEYFNIESKCSAWGGDIWADDNYEKLQGDYPKYEEAVEAALKYCLENLI